MPKHTIESLQALVNRLRTERNNFRAMYENAKDRKEIQRLQKKVEALQKELVLKDEVIVLLQEQNETLKLRVDELERMVFGKHKRKDTKPPSGSGGSGDSGVGSGTGDGAHGTVQSAPTKRPPFSYRRKTPDESFVTERVDHTINACPDCHETLRRKKTVLRFVEDIPPLTILKQLLHTVTKLSIETGYCPCCKVRKTAIPVPTSTVVLGENVRALICYQSVVQNQSYSQISRFLSDFTGIVVSDGEITNILESEKMKLVPECEAIKERIRSNNVVHYDETGWPVAKEEQGNHAWGITNPGAESEVAFLMGRSRGKGNAEELRGKERNLHVAVTDDYGAYRNTFEKHSLCWAHPLRKFRDLKDSPSLEEGKKKLCEVLYESFSTLYASLRKVLDEGNEHFGRTGEWNKKEIGKQERILRKSFKTLAKPHNEDPKKLKTLKESLVKNEDKYFTCLSGPGIPADNNKAERSLRHIVLKRKTSQGSKTQKGANTFSVLATVLLSLKAKHPNDFLAKYHELRKSLA